MTRSASRRPAADSLRFGVVACAGRMGRAILAAVVRTAGCRLAGASQYPGHPAVGLDAGQLAGSGPLGLSVCDDPREMMAAVDVVIDFSTPEATLYHLQSARAEGVPIVIGTTGLSPDQRHAVREAAAGIPIVAAPNMSVGATLLSLLTKRLAEVLDDGTDIEVLGMQHRHKVDAPSGTALALAQAAARGRGRSPSGATPRDGHTGPRPVGQIGIATVQGGDITGEHRVIFAAPGERLELGHRPTNRTVYAAGAVRAGRWLHRRPPGCYAMADVIGVSALSGG